MDKSEIEKYSSAHEDVSQLNRSRSFKSKQLVRSQAIRESQSPPRTVSPSTRSDAQAVDSDNIYKTGDNVYKTSDNVYKTSDNVYKTSDNVYKNNDNAHPNNDNYRSENVYKNNENFQNQDVYRSSDVYKNVSIDDNVFKNSDNVYKNSDNVYKNSDSVYKNSDSVYKNNVKTVDVMDDHDNRSVISDNKDVISSHNDRCSDVNYAVKDFSDFKNKPVEIQITTGAWDLESQIEQRQRTKRWLGQKNLSDSTRDLLSNSPRVACVCGNCAACPQCRGRRRRRACPIKQDSGIVCPDDCSDCFDTDNTGYNEGRKSNSVDVDDSYYCKCPERKETKPKSASLSRTDSDDKSEPTGPELVNFIKETLNKNQKDRATLLKIEKELHALVTDTGRCIVRFPVMTSYGRMLVHRCAALFQLSHNLDQSSKNSVMVSKSGTCGGRVPCTSFRAWCTTVFPATETHEPHAKSILKRASQSLEEGGNGRSASRSKSLEQREREYERVRRRIFSSDNCAQDEAPWPWNSGPIKLLTPDTGRKQLLKVQSLESSTGVPPWRSRGAVSKSHSFSGAPLHQHRILSRQGDLASSSWRLSPSSSGYKTLSLRSTDSVTPSPTGGASPEPSPGPVSLPGQAPGPMPGPVPGPMPGPEVLWAVTDMSSVPPGAIVIHPQTGRPLTNADGTIYHFDPNNPPIIYDPNVHTYIQDEQAEDTSERRRGRLEKQHSFIDNECDCQPSDDGVKCYCEWKRNENYQQRTTADKETNTKPQTPIKTHATEPAPEPTNQKPVYDQTTNQKPVYDQTTNQNADAQRYETNRQYDSRIEQDVQNYENRADISTNHRSLVEVKPNKLTNQDSVETVQQHTYPTTYRNEEVMSPSQQMNPYLQQDYNMQMMQGKMATDPNIRPMSIPNMMYQQQIQGYPYANQCRMDQQIQPMYHQHLVQQSDEQKQMTTPPQNPESTFRIDPSYTYGAEYGAACGSCVDNNIQHGHRSYSVPYNTMEMQSPVVPQYPVANVVLQQPHMQHYPYQDGVQWTAMQQTPKLLVPDVYPMVHYNVPYTHYNLMYPQVLPQTYPICQQVYPIIEKQEPQRQYKQTNKQTIPSCRNTPITPPVDKNDEKNEISLKIQQIKEQMAQMSIRDKRREDWRKKNYGNGILGNYPNGGFGGRVPGRTSNEQLTKEARVIVNSIRNMHAKNTYHQEGRRDQDAFRPNGRRFDRDERNSYRPPYLIRQMSPGTWCRRSPGPVHPVLNNPRRPFPDTRNNNNRRQP